MVMKNIPFVDVIFGLIMLAISIAWVVDNSLNFTYFMWLVVGYVTFNIINKIKMNKENEDL
jgi:uncharacterized membrane protein